MESNTYVRVRMAKRHDADGVDEVGGEPSSKQDKRCQLIKLEAADGTVITVDRPTACKSRLISGMLKDLGIDENPDDARLEEALPITATDGKTLQKLMDYCELKKDVPYVPKGEHEDPRINLSEEDHKYLKVTSDELTEILLGANFLDIPEIVDISTQWIANMALGKSTEEMRETYCLENDFTPQEEKELQERFAWVDKKF